MEIRDIFSDTDSEVCGERELGIDPDVREDGQTFKENAFIKCCKLYGILKETGRVHDTIVVADDSGLCIDFFDGAPGVYSSRFMGEISYDIKNKAILNKLENVPDEKRGAVFRCHVTAITEDGRSFDTEDEMLGIISHQIRGSNGFGYDPIFLLPGRGKTVAEISKEEKNTFSHRGKAFRKLKSILAKEGFIKIFK